jgi:hypothetical protein
MNSVRPLSVISTSHFIAENGDLRVLGRDFLPFDVVRLFFINAPTGAIRGQHAHKVGHQYFIVVSGTIEVRIEDPMREHHVFRMNAGDCLLVPPLHWAAEHFIAEASVLLVLCDLDYSEDEYIRNYSEFANRVI